MAEEETRRLNENDTRTILLDTKIENSWLKEDLDLPWKCYRTPCFSPSATFCTSDFVYSRPFARVVSVFVSVFFFSLAYLLYDASTKVIRFELQYSPLESGIVFLLKRPVKAPIYLYTQTDGFRKNLVDLINSENNSSRLRMDCQADQFCSAQPTFYPKVFRNNMTFCDLPSKTEIIPCGVEVLRMNFEHYRLTKLFSVSYKDIDVGKESSDKFIQVLHTYSLNNASRLSKLQDVPSTQRKSSVKPYPYGSFKARNVLNTKFASMRRTDKINNFMTQLKSRSQIRPRDASKPPEKLPSFSLPSNFKHKDMFRKKNVGNQEEEFITTADHNETVIFINASREYLLSAYQNQYSYEQEARNIEKQMSKLKKGFIWLSSYNLRWFLLRRSVATSSSLLLQGRISTNLETGIYKLIFLENNLSEGSTIRKTAVFMSSLSWFGGQQFFASILCFFIGLLYLTLWLI
ncbi:uncharacterized protein LOC128883024 isoform X2 [Hylaeus volcanicus]|uniref:uncharacterized protein LOC128883024 isoform X2 n=1 Tax=Hylaeus volcanicus TaxID=313075 RepID=UPI0023B8458E|nr:uncharacterized protein LOC128883024 isoform X2 [Hylaeus volcanicus]